MTFLAPGRLWLLALIGALAAAYVWLQRRRRHRAVRFTNVALLKAVAPRWPGWRRHVAAGALGVALAAMVVGMAEPARQVRIPKEAATVMLVLDTSASMQATDVKPTRLDAAIDAASSFVEDLPPQLRVGLVAFDRHARLLSPPTTDHETVLESIRSLTTGPGTAAGDALQAALDAIVAAEAQLGGNPSSKHASAIVLLSDGVTTVGRPVSVAAEAAAQAEVPVSTIAFGTESGYVEVLGELIPVPADPATMAAVAEATSGKFFEAASGNQLRGVYEDIGTRVGYDIQQRDVTSGVLAIGTVVLGVAAGLALLWNGRLV